MGSGSGGGACAEALTGWRGSACDTCTPAPAPAAGRTCDLVLDCYEREGFAPGCEYAEPTGDEAVKLARAVFACRCAS